jgi:glycosyltransferase involved in cell wall biosynthesis
MNIVMTTDTYWPRINGVTISIDTFKNELEKLGVNMYVFAPEYPAENGNHHKKSESVISFKTGSIMRFTSMGLFFDKEDRLVVPTARKQMYESFDRVKPDIVHIQTEFTTGVISRKYCRARKVPIVMTCHTYFEQYINFYLPFLPKTWARKYARQHTRHIYNEADIIISPSTNMKTVLEEYGIKRPILIIPTGINKDDFIGLSKEKEKASSWLFEKYPHIKGKKILLFVGRVAQEKNVDFLVEVVRRLKGDFPEIVLIMAGDGPHREALEKIIEKENLTKNIILLGYVDRKKLKSIYTLADIFTFASKTETQGLVTTEAMLCRTPVVAVGIMGTREVMNGDNGGFMVNEDMQEFTGKVRLLLTDEKLYKAKSEEAYQYAQNWTSEIMAKKLLAVYESLIKK